MSFELIVITVGAFFAAFINAAFATGGVYILLLASSSVLHLTVAVPLQGMFSVGSLVGRLYYFWDHIRWPMVWAVILGGIIGVSIGANIFVQLNEALIALLLGVILIIFIWAPFQLEGLRIKHPFFWIGGAHGFIATLFGLGGLLQPLIIKTRLTKSEVTATLAGMMLGLDILKFLGYSAVGFSFAPYVPHIIMATIAGLAGAYVGKRITHRISEQLFRRVFKIMVSLFALRLIYKGLIGLI